jgi:hypothetical protein
MALNSFPGVGETTSINNRVYRATQSGTYTVDVKPGVYRVTRLATTNIILGGQTIVPSTIPSMLFLSSPQTSITFNSTVSQNTVPWVTQPNYGSGSLGSIRLTFDEDQQVFFINSKNSVNQTALSTDGVSWVRIDNTVSQNSLGSMGKVKKGLNGYFAGGNYIALANWAAITSTNLRQWSLNNFSTVVGNGVTLPASAFGNGMHVLAGSGTNGTGVIAWSPTLNFSSGVGSGVTLSNETYISGTFGNGMFVMGGSAGSLRISTNGSTWTVANPQFGSQAIRDIIYAQGKFVAVGATGIISTSTNGETWVSRNSTFTSAHNVTDIVYSPQEDLFTAVAPGNQEVRISTDAITWQSRTLPSTFQDTSFAYGANRYLILQTLDNATFTPRTVGSMLITQPTVPFVDTYIVLDFKGEIETLT